MSSCFKVRDLGFGSVFWLLGYTETLVLEGSRLYELKHFEAE